MNLREIIRQSIDSLLRNRLRSGLTMLGIVWGLVTVVLLLSYGNSLGEGGAERLPRPRQQRHHGVGRTDQHAGRRRALRQEGQVSRRRHRSRARCSSLPHSRQLRDRRRLQLQVRAQGRQHLSPRPSIFPTAACESSTSKRAATSSPPTSPSIARSSSSARTPRRSSSTASRPWANRYRSKATSFR